MPLGDKLENQNPTLYVKTNERPVTESDYDDSVVDQFDQREIFGTSIGFQYPKQVLNYLTYRLDSNYKRPRTPSHPRGAPCSATRLDYHKQ